MANMYFNAFTNYLLNTTESKEDIYLPVRYNIWACSKNLTFYNSPSATLYTYCSGDNGKIFYYLGHMENMTINNVNSDDLPTDRTYQAKLNIPCSAYIFSKNEDNDGCILTSDFSYKPQDYKVENWSIENQKTANSLLYDSDNLHNMMHFNSTYNFSSGYDSGEYKIYDIPQDYFKDDVCKVSATVNNLVTHIKEAVFGAIMITRTSADDNFLINKESHSACLYPDKMTGTEEKTFLKTLIPVTYMELPLTYRAKNGIVNIEWSPFGIVRLE